MAAASAIKLDHLQVTMRPVSSLHRRPGNPRTHSTEQVRMIAESIREFGWTTPLIIDQAGGILGGHGRLDAADLLHLHEVPCIVLDHLTPAQRRALVIADNQIANQSGWNTELLQAEILAIQGESATFDLSLLGFDDKEFGKLMGVGVEFAPVNGNGKNGTHAAPKKNSAGASSTEPQLGNGFQYRLVVECQNEQHQVSLMERFKAEGLPVKPLIS
jgi:hypothetical protein